jgi:hypothetical protein
VVTHGSNPSTSNQKAEAGGSLVQGQFELQSEFGASLGYVVKPCLKKKKKKRNQLSLVVRAFLESFSSIPQLNSTFPLGFRHGQ